MNPTDLIQFLLEAANQVRVLHWGTSSYAEHEALGDLYEAINDATDKIAEIVKIFAAVTPKGRLRNARGGFSLAVFPVT